MTHSMIGSVCRSEICDTFNDWIGMVRYVCLRYVTHSMIGSVCMPEICDIFNDWFGMYDRDM